MASVIQASVGTSMSAATGRPNQRHLVYAQNQGAWWLLYLTSTQGLAALYSSNFSSWTAPTGSPMTLTAAHGSEGRDFGFAYANLASTDVLHMASAYAPGVAAKRSITRGSHWARPGRAPTPRRRSGPARPTRQAGVAASRLCLTRPASR